MIPGIGNILGLAACDDALKLQRHGTRVRRHSKLDGEILGASILR